MTTTQTTTTTQTQTQTPLERALEIILRALEDGEEIDSRTLWIRINRDRSGGSIHARRTIPTRTVETALRQLIAEGRVEELGAVPYSYRLAPATETETAPETETIYRPYAERISLDEAKEREARGEATLERVPADQEWRHGRYAAYVGGTLIGYVHRHYGWAARGGCSDRQDGWDLRTISERHQPGSPAAETGETYRRHGDTLARVRAEAILSADAQGLLERPDLDAEPEAAPSSPQPRLTLDELHARDAYHCDEADPVIETTGKHAPVDPGAVIEGWSLAVRIRMRLADGSRYTSQRVRYAIPRAYMPTSLHLREAGERVIREQYGVQEAEALWGGYWYGVSRADRRRHGDAATPRYIHMLGDTISLRETAAEAAARIAALETAPLSARTITG